jgi:hypothetical protein
MRNSQIQEVAMQTCAVGSSLLLLSIDASGPLATGLLMLSLVLCSGALGAMLASFPGPKS